MTNTQSLWEAEAPERMAFNRLETIEEADAVIIGGGITGVSLASILGKKGLDVCLLEREFIGHGTSGRTSAHLSTYWDMGYARVQELHGFEAAKHLANALKLGFQFIADQSESFDENVEFECLDGFLYEDKDTAHYANIYKEMEICQQLGFEVLDISKRPFPFPINAGFSIKNQGIFNPLKFLNALVKRLPPNVRVYESSPVIEVGGNFVKTPHGEAQAKHIVEATHCPIGKDLSQTALTPYESFIIAGTSDLDLPEGLYWDNDDPYHYIRKARYQGEEILVIGGSDHRTGQKEKNSGFPDLEKYIAHKNLIREEKFRWSAQFFEPVDAMPFIGRVTKNHLYVASGFSGNGLTMGAASAALLGELIAEKDNAFEEWFSPRRNFVFNKEFWKHNEEVILGLLRDHVPNMNSEGPLLAAGEGCVQPHLIHPKAFYRDHAGSLLEMSAFCPHMGGVVQWNSEAKTFDCPCHGSRFDCGGKVIEGPSMKDLEVLKRKEPVERETRLT